MSETSKAWPELLEKGNSRYQNLFSPVGADHVLVWGNYYAKEYSYIKIGFFACSVVNSPGYKCETETVIQEFLNANNLQLVF